MKSARTKANALALAAVPAMALLSRFPPDRYHFYPACPVYHYLHVYCPGCGSTRALAALLHGRLAEAMHYNPLFVVLLPMLCLFAGFVYWKAAVRNRIEWPQLPQTVLASLLGVIAAFTIVRNL